MTIKVVDFIERKNNTLQGFFSVLFTEFNMLIPGFTFHKKENQRWIEVPSKQDKHGNYSKVMSFTVKSEETVFKKRLMKALDEHLIEQSNYHSMYDELLMINNCDGSEIL